ncbi:MAG: glycosyltransferase [Pedosphaera sp.]|nr:glycosyltransferase [Pedosphaera sp.]
MLLNFAQSPKILVPHRHIISVNALIIRGVYKNRMISQTIFGGISGFQAWFGGAGLAEKGSYMRKIESKVHALSTDLGRFQSERWSLPRCFIVHARLAPEIRKVIRQINAALAGNFHLDADIDFGADESARGKALAALEEASFVICILDDLPPNVVFEYGYAKALRKPCVRMVRQGATVSIYKHFLQDGQREAPGLSPFDFDKHYSDTRDLILCSYDHTDTDAPKKILVEELAKKDAHGKSMGREIIETWAAMLEEKLANSGNFKPLIDFILAKARSVELGKPLFARERRKRFAALLKQGYERSPSGARKRVAVRGRELPDAAIEALLNLADKPRLSLVRKFLRLKRFLNDRRLLFAECMAVMKIARSEGFKNAVLNREAEKLGKSFARKWPEAAEMHHELGTFLAGLGRPEEAEKHLREALRINPILADAHSDYAFLLKQQNRLTEAEEHCKEAMCIEPDHVDAHCHYAIVLEEQNRIDEAVEYYRGALQINPGVVDIHYNYAVLVGKQKRPEEAEEHYRETLRLKPDHGEANYYYAILLGEQQRFEEAERHYRKALKSAAANAEMHNNYAALLLDQERLAEAEKQWRLALKLNPDFARAHYNYAILLARQGKTQAAESHYEETLRINPADAEAHSDYAIFLTEQNQLEKAAHHCTEAAKLRAEPTLDESPAIAVTANGVADEIAAFELLPIPKRSSV